MSIHDWCAAQDALRVIGRYVRLDQRGMGCCPLESITRVATTPVLPCGCILRVVLLLYYGLDARSLWQRILSGETF